MLNTRAHHHHDFFGPHWSVSNVAITLLLGLLFLLLLLLLVVGTAQPAYAQSSVPPTARQAAATMPQFAAKLRAGMAHAASRTAQGYHLQAPYRNPLRSRQDGGLPTDDIVYTNGPINGTTDAWTINFGFIVSNTFTVPSGGANLTSLSFGAWLAQGDVLQTVEVSITSEPFNGGTTYFDGIVNFTQDGCIGNQYGFNVCTESGTLTVNNFAQGTYWLNLQNATVNTGDPVYWDENSGPSLASEDSVGTIPSEAFTLLGGATTTTCDFDCPPECVHDKPENGFRIIHDFSSEQGSPAPGLAIDEAANLYGAASGGSNGLGLAFQMSSRGIFTPLYNFTGGAGGQNPLPEIIGPEKALYGTADGGIQNCGPSRTDYCGVVYRLRPSPSICFAALCSWNENVIYQFAGDPDGWMPNGNLVFDQSGSLYGTTIKGGIYGQGTVFQLTPSNGGWTEKVIYSFSGGGDGGQPSSLLLGHDGNLYGTTSAGGGGGGVIFQLVRSGDTWTATAISSYGPHSQIISLIGDASGNFYGTDSRDLYQCYRECNWNTVGRAFMMSPSASGWEFTILWDLCWGHYNCDIGDRGYDVFRSLVMDAAGNLYIAHGTEVVERGYYYGGSIRKFPHLEFGLVGFRGDNFRDLEAAPGGELYGTTGNRYGCRGTVWQLTPP